eukprot:GHVU01040777.1.p3 GENE.GHVU01040777.1~~GHVU01040777.1.p3  ORF type:complete len:108 (+),score=1.19 GHVU01040777.1:471-794(+)
MGAVIIIIVLQSNQVPRAPRTTRGSGPASLVQTLQEDARLTHWLGCHAAAARTGTGSGDGHRRGRQKMLRRVYDVNDRLRPDPLQTLHKLAVEPYACVYIVDVCTHA